jgi:hypothetical protein
MQLGGSVEHKSNEPLLKSAHLPAEYRAWRTNLHQWKTLEAQQTIERDVIRTASAGTQTATESAVERGVELQRGQRTNRNRKEGRTPSLSMGGKWGGS